MASLTKKTKSIRLRKHRKAGSARKASIKKNGSTPKFAVHRAS